MGRGDFPLPTYLFQFFPHISFAPLTHTHTRTYAHTHTHNQGFPGHARSFKEEGVDGALLLLLDREMLADLGVENPEQQKVFLTKIGSLSAGR